MNLLLITQVPLDNLLYKIYSTEFIRLKLRKLSDINFVIVSLFNDI